MSMKEPIVFNYVATDGKIYIIETSYHMDIQGCADVDGKEVIQGCPSYDLAMSLAIQSIEKEIHK